jgi:UDP-glucose 4-epimerase
MDISGKTVLITGGLSMIGLRTIEALLHTKAKTVVAYDNMSFGTSETALEKYAATGRVRLVKGDVLDAEALRRACESVDAVIHLAGFMSAGIAREPKLGLQVNTLGVLNVLDACRHQKVRKLVLASSSAVYGYGSISGGIDETYPLHSSEVPAPPILYGASKLIGEELCRLYGMQHAIDFTILRYSTVYGERQHYRSTNALYIIEACDRVAKGLPPVLYGDGMETKDFVYVGDAARANVLALEKDVAGEAFNISGGKALTVKYLADTVIRLSGSALEPVFEAAPRSGFRITSSSSFYYDNGKARRLLGWTPEVSIEEGIARLIAWRRSEGTDVR